MPVRGRGRTLCVRCGFVGRRPRDFEARACVPTALMPARAVAIIQSGELDEALYRAGADTRRRAEEVGWDPFPPPGGLN